MMVEASKPSSTIDPNGRARTGKLLIDLFRKASARSREPAGSPATERWTLAGTDHESTAQVGNSAPFVPERRDGVIGRLASSRAKVDRFFAQADATLELNRCHHRAGGSIAGHADLFPPRPSMFDIKTTHLCILTGDYPSVV